MTGDGVADPGDVMHCDTLGGYEVIMTTHDQDMRFTTGNAVRMGVRLIRAGVAGWAAKTVQPVSEWLWVRGIW